MANMQLNCLLFCVCVLLTQLTKSVYGQCRTPPVNQAVYEGTPNTIMTCDSPTSVSWTVSTSDNPMFPSIITNGSDTVTPALVNLFSVNRTNLTIRIGQSSPVEPPITTSGVYHIQSGLGGPKNLIGAKLVVVRQPPTCSLTAVNSEEYDAVCSLTYADEIRYPIYLKATWTGNDNFYKNEILNERKKVNGVFTSTSTIRIRVGDPRSYRCNVSFTKPMDVAGHNIAKNAPDFSASCVATRATAPCEDRVRNVAIYEGTLSTLINYCPGTPKGVKWSILATTNESAAADIVNYNDAVSPTYAADYEFGPSGLTIRNATTRATPPDHQLSTAGLYTVESGGNQSLFKVLVVHSGPECSCLQAKCSSDTQLSCTVTYADSSINPIFPVMTWMVNGAEHSNDEPFRSKTDQYVFTATSTITVNRNIVKNYQCVLTFGKPMFVKKVSMATNAPEFSKSCSAAECTAEKDKQLTITDKNPNKTNAATITPSITPTSIKTTSHCILNMRNIAVREGTLDVPMPAAASPCAVSWLLNPTTSEFDNFLILAPNCTRDSTLANLFTVNGSGLIIRNSTTTENGNPISTSGLYVAECNDNRNKKGAKLIVVRSGPECSCVPNGSSTVKLSCRVEFAETMIHPMPAIITWVINGKIYEVVQPRKAKLDMLVLTAISTITIDGSTVRDYQCILSFGQPTDLRYDYIATNAPEFNESCTTPVCSITNIFTTRTAKPSSTQVTPTTQQINISTAKQLSTAPSPSVTAQPSAMTCEDEISMSLINQAVYEGTKNTLLTLNCPTKVAWTLKPTTEELESHQLTNYDDVIAAGYTDLFGINKTGLIIKTVQGNKTTGLHPISTAGLYLIQINGSKTKYGAKLTVVRQPPSCNCTAISSRDYQLSCCLTYADSNFHPINATMIWTYNGSFYKNDTPLRRSVNPYHVSTSSILVDVARGDTSNYQCNVAFTKPWDIQFKLFASNAPTYSANCIPRCAAAAIASCSVKLENVAVYEGSLNTLIYYPAALNHVKWSTLPTTDELTEVDIVNYNDVVHPSHAADFAFSPSGLTIRKATTVNAEPGHQISTAGLYTVECGGNRRSVKFLVVKQGPMCSKNLSSDQSSVEVSCSIVYGDSTYDPIAAVFTLHVDGKPTASDTPQRIQTDAYTWLSKSTFTTAFRKNSTYECVQTFGQPTLVQDPIVAMNAPKFTQSCSV